MASWKQEECDQKKGIEETYSGGLPPMYEEPERRKKR
jgi:hypothetical protein